MAKLIELSSVYDDGPRTIRIGHASLRWPLPVAYMLGSSAARVFGVPVYGRHKPFWLRPTHRLFHRMRETKWRVLHRYHPRYRYHLVDTGLKPNYYDVDTLMLNAVMALVCRYVEQERGGEADLERFGKQLIDPTNNDPNAPPGLVESQGQMELDVLDIYRWWKHERPADKARRNELLTRLYGHGRTSFKPVAGSTKLNELVFTPFEGEEIALHDEFRALEKKIEDDEQKYLHLAIDLRGGMWT